MATTIDGILNKIAELERRLRESGNSEEVLNELEIIKAMLKDGYNASLGDAFSAKTIGPAIATGVELVKPSKVIELAQETGNSTERIMSQDAVTRSLNELVDKVENKKDSVFGISIANNSKFNSQEDVILLGNEDQTVFTTTDGKEIVGTEIRDFGDIVLIKEPEILDRRLFKIDGKIYAHKLEKQKVDLTNYYTKTESEQYVADYVATNSKIKQIMFNGVEQTISDEGSVDIVLNTKPVSKKSIDTTPTENSENLITSGGVYSQIGNLTNLGTTAQDNLVNAINELKNSAGGVQVKSATVTTIRSLMGSLYGKQIIGIQFESNSTNKTLTGYKYNLDGTIEEYSVSGTCWGMDYRVVRNNYGDRVIRGTGVSGINLEIATSGTSYIIANYSKTGYDNGFYYVALNESYDTSTGDKSLSRFGLGNGTIYYLE